MPGATSRFDLPYPIDTDHVADWPATVQDLAEDLDLALAVGRVARYKTFAQTFAHVTPTPVTYDTADGADQSGMTYSDGAFTVTRAGLWVLTSTFHVFSGPTGAYELDITVDNVPIASGSASPPPTGTGSDTILAICTFRLTVGRVVRAQFQQAKDTPNQGTFTSTWGRNYVRFDAYRIGG